MFDFASALVYSSFIGITAVSIGTALMPFFDSQSKKDK